jgi:hypothetical protein
MWPRTPLVGVAQRSMDAHPRHKGYRKSINARRGIEKIFG